jgi:hypothetical protein
MKNEDLITLQRYKDDLLYYAPNCLKIRTKSGDVTPFTFNKAQRYIHERLENQKGQTGKVRALILKGRQQGCCLSPNSLILTSDYRWVKLDDLQVGQTIVACDEESIGFTANGRKQSRKFRTAITEAKAEFYKETYEILLDNGAKLIATSDHKMLSKQRGGDFQQWRYIADFQIGDVIRIVARPPVYQSTYEDGWFGGIIDGEGSWRGGQGAKRLSIHQVEGVVLKRIKTYLNNIEMPYCEVLDYRKHSNGDTTKFGDKPVHRIDIHRLPYIIELLARCRPSRFINKDWHSGHELPGKAAQQGIKPWAKVVSIKPLGMQRVIDLQTSEKTFIVNGLVSHNSTYVGARFYHKVTWSRGIQAFILTHALEATSNLYKMAKRFYEHTPLDVRPQVSTSNAKELVFGLLDSGYKLGTAENKNVGRSATIQLLHGSEVGFWNNASEHATGIMQAVPNNPGTEIIMESTANGVGNYFHQQWQKAEAGISDFIAIFIPWYWQEEYAIPSLNEERLTLTADEEELQQQYNLTDAQLQWRRRKIVELSVNGVDGEKSFRQEYPNNAAEAFVLTGEDSYINPTLVGNARHYTAERYGPLLLAVDPARYGDCRTSFIFRQGRCAFGLKSYVKKDLMETAGLIYMLTQQYSIDKIFIDTIGVGSGLYDRCCELIDQSKLVAVNSSSTPLDSNKYKNKRAEMWGNLSEWLREGNVQIPDSDTLHADLCNIKYKFDSQGRLLMESKEDMRKRGVRSPDEADALCLTFALPSGAISASINKQQDTILNSLVSSFEKRQAAVDKSRR